ncbi:MAG: hypothetical protein HOB67_04140 [Acidimicrobiaceae bacterium]|jgi:hypothetical protein|nr:hypothetical protein [Acidimicrobiaceae bacterium]
MRTAVRRRIAVFVTVASILALTPGTALAAVATAPTGLAGTAGNAQVALTWTVPASDGGNAISDYTIEYSSTAGVVYSWFNDGTSTLTSATVTGLTNGTAYIFRVSAVNSSGTGPVSATAAVTPFVVHTANDPASFSACPAGVIPAAGFSDVSSTDVDCIKYYGITKGTTDTTYSPADPVSRWQMALFLTRMATKGGATLGDGTDQGFVDISGKSAEIMTAINQLKQLGVTVGKTATTYVPDDNVTREEMALFIARLLKKTTVGPGGNTEFVSGTSGTKEIKSNDTDHNFTDMPVGLMESRNAIINLWNLGVTDVQTATTYEPATNMTRRAMATFMARALAHTNARPAGLILQASGYRVQNGTAVTMSVTHRTANLDPISGSYVDTFLFHHSTVTTVTRFDTNGQCSAYIIATSLSSTRCSLDSADPRTDASGNLATFLVVPPYVNFADVWAWTEMPTTVYDNDIHAASAQKVTIETHS